MSYGLPAGPPWEGARCSSVHRRPGGRGRGGHETALLAWMRAGPKETVVSPASATAAMVLMLPGVYAVPTHFYLTLDQPRSNQHRSNPATPEVVALSC